MGNIKKDDGGGNSGHVLKHMGDVKFFLFSVFLHSHPLYNLFSLYPSSPAPKGLLVQFFLLPHIMFVNLIPILVNIHSQPTASKRLSNDENSLDIPQAFHLFYVFALPFIFHMVGALFFFVFKLFLPESPEEFRTFKSISRIPNERRQVIKNDFFKKFFIWIFIAIVMNLAGIYFLMFNSLNYTLEVNQKAATLAIQGIAVGCIFVEGIGYTTLNIWVLISLIKKKRKPDDRMRKFLTKFIPTGVAMDIIMLLRWKKKIGTKTDADKDKLKEVLEKRTNKDPEEVEARKKEEEEKKDK